jgi:hypothetical protein
MTRSHRLCGIVMLLSMAGSSLAADDKPCGQGGRPIVVEKLPAPACKVSPDAAASVCVDARVCYTEEGLRTFVAIFQAAAAQGVENALIRAMNQAQIASPLKEIKGQPPAKEAQGKGGDKDDDDDDKDLAKDKDDDDKKDRRDDKDDDEKDDGDKDRPKDDDDKKRAPSKPSKDKDDREDKDDDDNDDDKDRRQDD